ncbi:MAG: filamentous hemagglutinin N-terminal domain-containing protein, partial [Gammaproteobacteria bacterium]|nr:filamentous hemagglutinin N-terminal domain-containing protein [Gammaproteobacteria bacterium]
MKMSVFASGFFLLTRGAYAEVITDGTLGKEARALAGPDYAIKADLGVRHGGNLFHSFRDFNLHSGESAVFSGPASINNVLARVTGGRESEINGALRSAIPDADLYLINPAGIVFGPDASLDVQGSFHATAADYIKLGEQGHFNASAPENSTFSTAPPSAFGFSHSDPAPIILRESSFTLPESETFSIIGGDVEMTDCKIQIPAGGIHIASVAGSGEVGIDPKTAELDAFIQLGNIRIANSTQGVSWSAVDTSGNGSQGIFVRGGWFVLNNAFIQNRVLPDQSGSHDKPGGGIAIAAREAVILQNLAVLRGEGYSSAAANDITIRTGEFTMRDHAIIDSDTWKLGPGGNITVQADRLSMTDSRIESKTMAGGPGGNIHITVKSLQMHRGARINALTSRSDQAGGQIIITANEFNMVDDAFIDTETLDDSTGEGGKVRIQAHRFSMADTAWIITASFSRGQGGAIDIYADDLYVSGRAAIAAGAFAEGKGGDVNVHVQHTASLSGAAVIASGTEGTGTGGKISLHAGRIVITGAAAVSSASEGENRFVKQKERLSELPLSGGGDAGQVRIEADMLVLTDGAAIDSSSGGKGMAGDILIIFEKLNMRDSRISTSAEQAHGGSITMDAGSLLALYKSAITASVGGGAGNGGNITTINSAPKLFVLNNGSIVAQAA